MWPPINNLWPQNNNPWHSINNFWQPMNNSWPPNYNSCHQLITHGHHIIQARDTLIIYHKVVQYSIIQNALMIIIKNKLFETQLAAESQYILLAGDWAFPRMLLFKWYLQFFKVNPSSWKYIIKYLNIHSFIVAELPIGYNEQLCWQI